MQIVLFGNDLDECDTFNCEEGANKKQVGGAEAGSQNASLGRDASSGRSNRDETCVNDGSDRSNFQWCRLFRPFLTETEEKW